MGHYRSPERLLQGFAIERPEEIDLEAISEHCGATILYQPLRGCAARIVASGDRAIITIDSDSPLQRQRFSAGHELGHWMHDRGRIGGFACAEKELTYEWGRENPEKRANDYAADLLMPRFMFSQDARCQPITFDSVRTLADRYRTSLTATAIRLVELGTFPAMIICHAGGSRWKWFRRGPEIPEQIWPVDEPGQYTIARELLARVETVATPSEVSAAEWFDLPEADRYSVHEDSKRISEVLILSLIWWKDERQLIDLESA